MSVKKGNGRLRKPTVDTIDSSWWRKRLQIQRPKERNMFPDNSFRKHCLMTSLLMCCSSQLYRKPFPSILNKTTYFHMHIYISEFVIPLWCRYQVFLSCTCKEYSKDMQFLPTSPYYNPTTYTSCESLRTYILDCITSHNYKEDIYKSSSWW